ncbi:MAG TPA: PAS domain S-box protein [Gemmatimonadales bacterium]|jgi:PAS domain S-box-containing protein
MSITLRYRGTTVTIPVRNVLAAAFLIVVALLTLAITISLREAQRFEAASRHALDANAQLLELERTLSAVRDAETGQRGYLLTNDTSYLDPFRTGIEEVEQHLAVLGRIAARAPDSSALRLEELLLMQHLVDAKRREMERSIEVNRQQGPTAATALIRGNAGKLLMDSLRALAGAVEQRQRQALERSMVHWQITARRNYTAVEVLALVGVLLIGTMLYATARVLAERRARQAALEAERALLEQRVAERTIELRQQHRVALEAQRHAEQAALQAEEQTVRAEEEAARAEEERLRAEEQRTRAEQSEAEARVTEARYRALAEVSPDAILVVVGDRVVYGNAAAARLLRVERAQELVGLSPFEFIAAQYHDTIRKRIEMVVEKGQTTPLFEYQWKPLDGSTVEVETAAGPVVWQGQTGVHVVARDVSERKRAERALTESEIRFRRVADTAPVMIWMADATKQFTWFNRGWLAFTGRAMEQELGDGWTAGVHPDDLTRCTAIYRNSFDGRLPFSMEYRLRRTDGQYRWVRDDGIPRYAADGSFEGYIGVCLDITDMREATQRLGQVQRLESLGRLAGGVAHETNNQMTVVLGAAEFLLRRTDLPQGARDDLAQIRHAADRAANVSAQLLAYSRRQLLRPQVLDLNTVVAGIQPALRRLLGPERTLLVQLAASLGRVEADPGQLEQVLINLVLNARDALESGGHVSIETRPVVLTAVDFQQHPEVSTRAGPYTQLAVSDTGPGMDRETLGRVFEPFFTTKPIGQGTGLGLATVYGIVKQSNGYIWAYSEPGKGTTFKIYLPVTAADVTVVAPPVPRPGVQRDAVVLLVDDEPAVREYSARALTEVGYTVLSAGSSAEALELLGPRQAGPAILVTDVAMAEVDGRTLGERLRERYPGLPVLYMSGFTGADVIRRGLMDADQPFLQKPFGPDELVHQVQLLLDGQNREREQDIPPAPPSPPRP